VTSSVRRAGAFAAVGSLSLAAPVVETAAAPPYGAPAAAAPFAVIAAFAAFVVDDGPVFDLFARPGERREKRLYGLIGFTLAATALVLLAAVSSMPTGVGVGTILLVAYGNLAVQVVRKRFERPIFVVIAFAVGGGLAFLAGQLGTMSIQGTPLEGTLPKLVFLAVSAGLLGTLLRTILTEADDPYVMLSVGLGSWLLAELVVDVGALEVGLAVAVTVLLGYVSWALDTASIAGMLTGVFVGLLTIVLGGYRWFAVLMAFFAIGGLSTKYRYETKAEYGVAEDNEGARGSGNVLANAAVGLACVVAYAAVPLAPELLGGFELLTPEAVRELVPLDRTRPVFLFAFVGSFATAMSDTLSSEIGGVYENPRLITTMERVEPGTDGGVTWQGELAGLVGAGIVAGIAAVLFGVVDGSGAGVLVLAGVAGMTVDSLLGATVEGQGIGNGAVNFLATLSGGVVAAALVLGFGFA
jgi:uncharacterized membrane protein